VKTGGPLYRAIPCRRPIEAVTTLAMGNDNSLFDKLALRRETRKFSSICWVFLTTLFGTWTNAEAVGLRGLVVDAARTPESLSYYYRLIDFSHDWGINALLFRLTDDQGSAIKFASHPELITHLDAFTPADLHDLAIYGRQQGVELIPEIESFGHTNYVYGSASYAYLMDWDPRYPPPSGSPINRGLIPVDPDTLNLMADLYAEAAAIFPSNFLHGGCDEVGWGGAPESQDALQTRSRTQIWADYVNALNQLARSNGKDFIVWGDHVLRSDPGILALMDTSIVIDDWNYWDADSASFRDFANSALAHGNRVIGSPALIWSRWGPHAGGSQLDNIDAYADAYLSITDPNALGVIVTNWFPSRYLQNSIWDGFAFAAVAINEGSAVAQSDARRRFVERYYGATWSTDWSTIFQNYDQLSPRRDVGCPAYQLPWPWMDDESLRQVIACGDASQSPFGGTLGLLDSVSTLVTQNAQDFASFRLSVRYLDYMFWRNSSIIQERQAGTLQTTTALINEINNRDAQLLDELTADWAGGRPTDSPLLTQPAIDTDAHDQLVFRFRQAAAYSAQRAQDPVAFFNYLQSL
jgi:hypothetical protein